MIDLNFIYSSFFMDKMIFYSRPRWSYEKSIQNNEEPEFSLSIE
jgi:hypothetical protein